MIKSSALVNENELFLLKFDSRSLNAFLTKFTPQCIDKRYDEECAAGVCFPVFAQRQQN